MKNNTCIIQTISSESVVIKEHKSFTIFSIKCDDELKRSINDTCKNNSRYNRICNSLVINDCFNKLSNASIVFSIDCFSYRVISNHN